MHAVRVLTPPPDSVNMLTTVYQDNRREFVTKLGLDLYQSVLPAAAGGEEPVGDAPEVPATSDFAPEHPRAQQQPQRQQQQVQQLQMVVAGGVGRREEGRTRAPVAHLLSLVPAKRAPAGACRRACPAAAC